MIRFIAVKCPQCGANLQIEEGRKIAYCTYCGAKILVDNDNEYVYRHIDEAEIRKTEAEERIRMRELDLEEREESSSKRKATLWVIAIIACILMMVIGVLADQEMITIIFMPITMWIGIAAWDSHDKEKAEKHERMERQSGKIKMPMQMPSYQNHYVVLERALRSAGFHNITCVNLNDLTFGLLTKPGTVAKVTINGEIPLRGNWYYPDDEIVISYHGKQTF